MNYSILGLSILNNNEELSKLQEILTRYGCAISTRIHLQHRGDFKCANKSIMIIEVVDKTNEIYDELAKYWELQIMKFDLSTI